MDRRQHIANQLSAISTLDLSQKNDIFPIFSFISGADSALRLRKLRGGTGQRDPSRQIERRRASRFYCEIEWFRESG